MTLKDKLNSDIKDAMKAKNKVALRALRAIKSAIMIMETDGSGNEITEDVEIKLLQKQVKQRQESFDIYVKQGRADLSQIEKEEIDIISTYLPKQMDEVELKALITSVVEQVGASGMKDMGKVMGMVSAKVAGKAEGKVIAALVKSALL